MLKKIGALVLAGLGLTVTSYGAGFYVGAGVGVDAVDYKNHATVVNPSINVINDVSQSAQGILGSLFAGYQWRIQQFFLAGELNANLMSSSSDSSNVELVNNSVSKTAIKIDRSFGISFLPGLYIDDLLVFYGHVGYTRGRFVINTTDNSLANINTMLNGVRFGVGMRRAFCNNFAMRLEYAHINYQSNSFAVYDPIG